MKLGSAGFKVSWFAIPGSFWARAARATSPRWAARASKLRSDVPFVQPPDSEASDGLRAVSGSPAYRSAVAWKVLHQLCWKVRVSISPPGYHEGSDSVLVMDVARFKQLGRNSGFPVDYD